MTTIKKIVIAAGITVVTVLTTSIAAVYATHENPPLPTVLAAAPVSVPTKPEVLAVATLVNQERVTAGLPALADNALLDNAAAAKCADMVAKDYWSHNAPDGTTPWTFIRSAGYSYHYAGENLAYGFTDSAATVTGWMNSPGHRANILRADFMEVGTAVCYGESYQHSGGQYLIVQEFATPY